MDRQHQQVVRISRVELARRFRVHRDTISHLLHDGLAFAVVEFGGHSKTMTFDDAIATKWDLARRCIAWGGQPCTTCHGLLADAIAVGAHMLKAQHRVGGCEECTAPEWKLGEPCSTGPRRDNT